MKKVVLTAKNSPDGQIRRDGGSSGRDGGISVAQAGKLKTQRSGDRILIHSQPSRNRSPVLSPAATARKISSRKRHKIRPDKNGTTEIWYI